MCYLLLYGFVAPGRPTNPLFEVFWKSFWLLESRWPQGPILYGFLSIWIDFLSINVFVVVGCFLVNFNKFCTDFYVPGHGGGYAKQLDTYTFTYT